MKTLLLAPELFAADGGIARILRLYLKALCQLSGPKDEVRLIVLNDPALPAEPLREASTPALAQALACGRSRTKFIGRTLAAARRADLLVCGHLGQLPVAWAARFLYPNLRYVAVAHGVEAWTHLSPMRRLALQGASAVWCVSDYTRRRLLEQVQLRPERLAVLPNGFDPVFERPADGDGVGSAPVLLTVSRLCHSDRYKGIDVLIRSLREIRARVPEAQLRIVGEGDDRGRLEQLAAASGVAEGVRFLGRLSDPDLRREFARCRVFVLPSTGEGFGLVFLEAMAQGRPCVGAEAGAIPEVLSPDTGLLCPPEDEPALAAACIAALERRWEPAAIRARAHAFSYAAFRDRLRALLPG